MTTTDQEQLVADLLCERIRLLSGSVGVIVQDVPHLVPGPVLAGLAKVLGEVDLRICYLATSSDDVAQAVGLPADKFTSNVQQAEHWRNERGLNATIVVIAAGEQARLSSLQEFSAIGPADLKALLVDRAKAGQAGENEVLHAWWTMLRDDANISFSQLVGYYHALPDDADFKNQSSRELPRLGLLADPRLFDDPRDRAIRTRITNNRELVGRLQTLTEKDRRTIQENIAKEADSTRQAALKRSHRLLRQLRRGEQASQLTLAEAEDLLASRARRPVTPNTPQSPNLPEHSPIPIPDTSESIQPDNADSEPTENPGDRHRQPANPATFAAKTLFSDDQSDDDDLDAAVKTTMKALGEIDRPSSMGTTKWDLDLPSGVVMQGSVRREVLDIVTRLVNTGVYGGWISGNGGDIEERIRGFRGTEDLNEIWTSEKILEYLSNFDDAHGHELRTQFAQFDEARNKIVPLTTTLAAAPLMVTTAGAYRHLVKDYVDSYQSLLHCIRDVYSQLFAEYTQDVDHVVSRILMLDTITFGSGPFTIAMLTPLHPLYLWRYSEFARIVANQRRRLSPRDEKLVVDAAKDLPNFLTSLCLPDLTHDTPQVLPQVSSIDQLPYFAAAQERSVGNDGFDAVERIVRAFLDAHPPARTGLRIALLDPPGPGPYLSLLTRLAAEDKIQGAHLMVLYKGRGAGIQSLGLDEEDEARVAQVFRATADDRRFSFEIRSLPLDSSQLPADVLAHIMVAFDQSGGKQDAFAVVEHPIQPLTMPQRLKFRVHTRTVDLEPAPGGPFAAYFNVAQLVAKQAPASRIAVRQDGDVRGKLAAAASTAPWFVIADRHIDRDLQLGSLQVFSGRDGAREVVAFADATDPFRRTLRDVVRQYNTAVSDAELDDLLLELTELLDVGALALGPNLDGQVDQNRTKGLLGTLIAARWYKSGCPGDHRRLLISLDDKTARRWLHLREDGRRADLLGIEIGNEVCAITVFEVKAMQDTSSEFQIKADVASGPAVDQLLSTGALLADVFNPDRDDELITTPARREVLREHVYRELAKRSHDAEDRKAWANAAQQLFEGQCQFKIDLHLVEVSIGVDTDSLISARHVRAHAPAGASFDLTVTQLNESGVEALEPSVVGDEGPADQPIEDVPLSPNSVAYLDASASTSPTDLPRPLSNRTGVRSTPESSVSRDSNAPRAYLGQAPGQYGKPHEVWYEPHRTDHPLANAHIAITGETGSGKTQATKAILHDLMAPPIDLPALILDFKDDYASVDYTQTERLSMFDASVGGLPFNPLVPPTDPTSGLANPMAHTHQLVGILKRIYKLGDQQAFHLREAVKETYSIQGLDGKPFAPQSDQGYLPFEAIRDVLERESHGALIGRLSPIFDLGLFSAEGSEATLDELLDGRSVIRLSQLPGDEVKNAVAEFLLMALYNHLIRRPQPRVLSRLVVLDEAWRLVQSPFLEPLMREGRAFGAGVIVATQYPKDLPDAVSGATATKLFFSQTQVEQIREIQKSLIGKASGSDAEQLRAIVRSMRPLTCLVQSAHQEPYARTSIRPYYERVTEDETPLM